MNYIFDIGSVLVTYNQSRYIAELSAQYNAPADEVRKLFTHDLIFKVETGVISHLDYFNDYVTKVLHNTHDEWINSWMNTHTLLEEGVSLLKDLKAKGHKVYILSNQAEYNRIAIEKKFPGFYSMCTYNFLSFELGYYKPDIRIYEAAIKGIGATPAECTFFDDLQENIDGAKKAGMNGICFAPERIQEIRAKVGL